jgi:hypothetical protein
MCYLFHLIPILLFFLTTACAHRISITPPLHQLDATEISRIEKSVGYYISPDDLEKQVVTPAGGGDKVKYLPYKESEPALKTILSNIFIKVYPISSLYDTQFITSNYISYIFIPEIETNSSYRSSWIWPPSDFIVTINCKAIDASGKVIWQKKIKGEAHLRLPDVYRDHSLAAKAATEKAFSELQHEILNTKVFQ